jgi:hypothetical protein
MTIRTVHNGFVYAQMKADRAKKHLDELNRELGDVAHHNQTQFWNREQNVD